MDLPPFGAAFGTASWADIIEGHITDLVRISKRIWLGSFGDRSIPPDLSAILVRQPNTLARYGNRQIFVPAFAIIVRNSTVMAIVPVGLRGQHLSRDCYFNPSLTDQHIPVIIQRIEDIIDVGMCRRIARQVHSELAKVPLITANASHIMVANAASMLEGDDRIQLREATLSLIFQTLVCHQQWAPATCHRAPRMFPVPIRRSHGIRIMANGRHLIDHDSDIHEDPPRTEILIMGSTAMNLSHTPIPDLPPESLYHYEPDGRRRFAFLPSPFRLCGINIKHVRNADSDESPSRLAIETTCPEIVWVPIIQASAESACLTMVAVEQLMPLSTCMIAILKERMGQQGTTCSVEIEAYRAFVRWMMHNNPGASMASNHAHPSRPHPALIASSVMHVEHVKTWPRIKNQSIETAPDDGRPNIVTHISRLVRAKRRYPDAFRAAITILGST